MDVPSGNCSVEFPEQTPTTNTYSWANGGTGTSRDETVVSSVSGVSYTVVGPGTICGTTGAHTDGSTSGTMTIKGYTSEAETTQKGIWIE